MSEKTKTERKKPAKKKTTTTDAQLLIWGIPTEVKSNFKSACAQRGTTMRDAVINFMSQYKA